jgi:hypothetical protein
MPGFYEYGVDDTRVEATVAAVLDGPLTFIDTCVSTIFMIGTLRADCG